LHHDRVSSLEQRRDVEGVIAERGFHVLAVGKADQQRWSLALDRSPHIGGQHHTVPNWDADIDLIQVLHGASSANGSE
jgi:hypothetical protein